MIIRDALASDAAQMSAFLKELTALGKRISPDSEAHVLTYYINDPHKIRCSVACDGDEVLGFQSLRLADEGNQWGVEPGWGIIGTHIKPSAARRGVGKALFEVTQAAAKEAGLMFVDATIGETNEEGLGYYEAMGFRSYRATDGAICKRFEVGR